MATPGGVPFQSEFVEEREDRGVQAMVEDRGGLVSIESAEVADERLDGDFRTGKFIEELRCSLADLFVIGEKAGNSRLDGQGLRRDHFGTKPEEKSISKPNHLGKAVPLGLGQVGDGLIESDGGDGLKDGQGDGEIEAEEFQAKAKCLIPGGGLVECGEEGFVENDRLLVEKRGGDMSGHREVTGEFIGDVGGPVKDVKRSAEGKELVEKVIGSGDGNIGRTDPIEPLVPGEETLLGGDQGRVGLWRRPERALRGKFSLKSVQV